jgi:phage terminase large subunit-like protein
MLEQQSKYRQYLDDILTKKLNHGSLIHKLCENLKTDLENESCEFYFDYETANKYIKFIEKLSLTESKWAGQPFILENWQAFIIANMFGWKVKGTDKRRYDEITIHIPKKNGKTALASALAIAYSFIEESDYAGQIYVAATNREQANICFRGVKRTIELTKGLANYYRVMQYAVISKKNQTNIKALSGDAPSVEGFGSSLVIFDEYHLQKTDELKENLITGQAAREGAMFVSISTAGTDKTAPYYSHIQSCKNIVNGFSDINSHLCILYESDSQDWRDVEVWKQANPNYGISVLPDKLEKEYKSAIESPSKQPSFITKHLNIWADSASTWIDSKTWQALDHKLKLSDFEGEDCYLGLDLGTTGDFSALAILFEKDGKYYTFYKFWIPEQMAGKRTKADGLKFKDWARSGFIKLTEGNSTDFTEIEEDIARLSSRFNIISLSYDSAFASMLITRLINEWGINCRPFKQAITSTAAPTKQLNEWILKGELLHENNPVMNWMLGNVQIWTDDANGNYKVHKGKSRNKVDGVTALVNAIGDYLIDYSNNYGNGDAIWV